MLVERGPYGLFELARERYGYQPLPDDYTAKCHLCVDVRRHLVHVKGDEYTSAELRPARFYENIWAPLAI